MIICIIVLTLRKGSRKLACSKELEGCARCVRENIKCNYSEQKPMGRPRKRHYSDGMKENEIDMSSLMPNFDTLPFISDDFPIHSYVNTSSMSYSTCSTAIPTTASKETLDRGWLKTPSDGRPVCHFGAEDLKRPIDFGADDTLPEKSLSPHLGLPNNSAVDLFQDYPAPPSVSGSPCSCLATMYLAMSSLQQLPSDVETALGVVRAAANTAQTVLRCEECGKYNLIDLGPRIEGFQNTMLMSTLLPTIANGYKRLLAMVEVETGLAQATGTKKFFRIMAYGGFVSEMSLCQAPRYPENAEMEPMEPIEWRNTVRGLLRADIYGIPDISSGLKGIISEMEQRQLDRHAVFDQLRDSGCTTSCPHSKQYLGDKEPLCVRLLDNAKLALDSLVIP
jgi:hypothetical protein